MNLIALIITINGMSYEMPDPQPGRCGDALPDLGSALVIAYGDDVMSRCIDIPVPSYRPIARPEGLGSK